MQNFQVWHQNPKRVKMIFLLLQPLILILSTNPSCKQWKASSKTKERNTFNLHIKIQISYCLWSNQKSLYRQLASFRFISNFKNNRKAAICKCSDKRCKIFQNNLNKINKFTMSDGQVWKIRRKIDCHATNVIYIRNEKCTTKKEHKLGKQ